MKSLHGHLLVSSGGLFDFNFRHTVVLIGEHGAQGAGGVILNRPLDVTIGESIPALGGLVDPEDPLFEGGPVQPDQPMLLAEAADPGFLDLPVFGSVGFLTRDIPESEQAEIRRARIFAGHAGWGPGQLEAEMEEDAWILEPATEDDVFSEPPELLWHRVLERKGPEYAALAKVPFDPSMN